MIYSCSECPLLHEIEETDNAHRYSRCALLWPFFPSAEFDPYRQVHGECPFRDPYYRLNIEVAS